MIKSTKNAHKIVHGPKVDCDNITKSTFKNWKRENRGRAKTRTSSDRLKRYNQTQYDNPTLSDIWPLKEKKV